MVKRPRITIKPTTSDKVLELIGWMLLLAMWVLTISNYSNLPDKIPTHYNAAGEIDQYGAKVNLLILAFIATIIFVGPSILTSYPHMFNYPSRINQQNALKQYTNMTRMLRILKLALLIIFGYLIYHPLQNSGGLDPWFMPVSMGFIFVSLVYFVIKSLRIKS